MAELICTVDEFHRFIGPSIRNKIQYMTKRKKQELKHVCQRCGKKKTELDSAYIRGMDRKKIINGVLSRYVINEDKQIIENDFAFRNAWRTPDIVLLWM